MTVRTTKLVSLVTLRGKRVYADQANDLLKVSSSGRFQPIAEIMGRYSKGEVRKLRKALRVNGCHRLLSLSLKGDNDESKVCHNRKSG